MEVETIFLIDLFFADQPTRINKMNKKTRILVISNYRNKVTSRPEAEIFVRLAKENKVEITVMTVGESFYAQQLREAGARVIDFLPSKKFDKQEIAFIREELVKGQYDILHLFYSAAIINGLRAAKDVPVKVIVYRGLTGNVHWYDPTLYFKVLSPRVDKIWCNSLSVKEQIDEQLFVDKNKTIVITKGHDKAWYEGIEKADLSGFGIQAEDFVAVTVANDRKMKGLKYLLKAIEMLDRDVHLKLVILGGDDKFKEKYMKRIHRNADKVIFTGYRLDNLQIVSASDACVSSSIKGESFQKSVAEAMHLGICPIITDIPGNKGMVEDKKSGLIIPKKNAEAIKDALMHLFSDKHLCKEYGINARAHITQNFDIQETVKKVMAMYEDLLAT